MKRIHSFTLLLFISIAANAQFYYGAGFGLACTKQGADPLLFSNAGYALNNTFLGEVSLQGSLSGTIAPSAMVGLKKDLSEASGIHLLAGIADDLDYNIKPVTFRHNYYAAYTARLWMGHCSIQVQYFNKTAFCTIGIIGFAEKRN